MLVWAWLSPIQAPFTLEGHGPQFHALETSFTQAYFQFGEMSFNACASLPQFCVIEPLEVFFSNSTP